MTQIVQSSVATDWMQQWWRIWSGIVKIFLEPDTSLRCAGTAFFGFLSLFPAVGIFVFLYGLVADRGTLGETIGSLQYLLPTPALAFRRAFSLGT